jgi:hypothetical protein
MEAIDLSKPNYFVSGTSDVLELRGKGTIQSFLYSDGKHQVIMLAHDQAYFKF